MSRIAIVTDAWHPQINGVVTTLTQTIRQLEKAGHQIQAITPQLFTSIPCPTYPEIRLALPRFGQVSKKLLDFAPNAVHIATEGPLGWLARRVCRRYDFPFTTSYHTRFPEYVRIRLPIPLALSYGVVRGFHDAAVRTMVATPALADELKSRGFSHLAPWSRGVDTELFTPGPRRARNPKAPVMVYVGRVAVEKNIEAFLTLDLPGTKVIVGDGPARKELEQAFPAANFVGYRTGAELAEIIGASDVMVFPSLTDTFGVVMLEAMACGVPVAAFPVTGPINVVRNGINGWLDNDLATAVRKALTVSPESCRQTALLHSWQSCSRQFVANLAMMSRPLGAHTGTKQARSLQQQVNRLP